MDPITDTGSAPGTSGLEVVSAHDNGSSPEPIIVTGAIDPDAARTLGSVGADTSDFLSDIGDTVADTGPRARKPRGPNKRKQPQAGETAALNINGVEKILFSIHAVMAGVTATPELMLDESESKKLAKAIEGVTDQYKLTLDPKIAAYIDLATTLGMIYGPRGVAIYVRKKMEKAKPVQRAQEGNVTELRPVVQTVRPQPNDSPFAFDPATQKPYNGPQT